MVIKESSKESSIWEIIDKKLTSEITKTHQELESTDLKISQCEMEIRKLTQKNAAITGEIKKMQNNLNAVSPKELKTVYDIALDTQQRLFIMRIQLEKLQCDRNHQQYDFNYFESLREEIQTLSEAEDSSGKVIPNIEMIKKLIEAQEAERKNLSMKMHDGPAQALSNFVLQTEIALRLFDIDQIKAKEELVNLKSSASESFQSIRDFIFNLRPVSLDELGVIPTLARYVQVYKKQYGFSIELKTKGQDKRLSDYIEVLILRSVQELLGNSMKLSQASQANINLELGETVIKLGVEDNGKGYDEAAIQDGESSGINLLRESIQILGGEFEIRNIVGEGTKVFIQIPIAR